jgi:hypothetical protein
MLALLLTRASKSGCHCLASYVNLDSKIQMYVSYNGFSTVSECSAAASQLQPVIVWLCAYIYSAHARESSQYSQY